MRYYYNRCQLLLTAAMYGYASLHVGWWAVSPARCSRSKGP